jgi:hypothetical protein
VLCRLVMHLVQRLFPQAGAAAAGESSGGAPARLVVASRALHVVVVSTGPRLRHWSHVAIMLVATFGLLGLSYTTLKVSSSGSLLPWAL